MIKKRLLGLAICLWVFACAVTNVQAQCPDGSSQDGNYCYTIEDHNTTITKYIGSGGDVVIPDKITGKPVVSIGDNAFFDCPALTSVTIPDSIISIGNEAFVDCVNLTSAIIGNNVESIGDNAFEYCDSLTSVSIPDSVITIGARAFNHCRGLTSATIGSNVESIGDFAFSNCYDLTGITIPDSVISIGERAFYDCINLTSATIGSNVQHIGILAFADCESLTSITIPDSVTSLGMGSFYQCKKLASVIIGSGIASIGEATFSYCYSLTNLTIPGTVTSIERMAFDGCRNLASVTLESGVTTIADGAFFFCDSLTGITIPDSVTTIGGSAFRGCSSLTSITIPDSVTTISSAPFGGCSSLTEIIVDADNPAYISSDNSIYSKDLTELIQYPAGLAEDAFIIPGSVTGIGAGAFLGCSNLTSITIPDSVTTIGWSAFGDCSFTSITIPDSVTTIGDWAFYGCSNLTNITISDNVTIIGSSTFKWCTNLTHITIPDRVTSIGYEAFSECHALTSITIGNSVENIDDRAFEYCSSLTNATIPDSVTTIGNQAFYACNALSDANFLGNAPTMGTDVFKYPAPDFSICYTSEATGFTTPTWEGYPAANCACSDDSNCCLHDFIYTVSEGQVTITGYQGSDADMVIPSEIDGMPVVSIGDSAFVLYDGLTSVTIPDSVASIGNYAFLGCQSLSVASFLGDAPTIGLSVFSFTAPDFNICYTAEATGFTTPTWEGYPATDCACSYDTDCEEGYGCADGVCIANEPPVFISEPRWPYGYWPVMSSDPANPNKPQSETELFFAYDDDGVGCQTAPTLDWMYRPVEMQDGQPVPVGNWVIEVPGWSFMYWVLIEEPTIADTAGPGLFEFKMSVTDCLNQTTDSEDFYGKRYYFQIDP